MLNEPLPSWPSELSPQQSTSPLTSAHACCWPTAGCAVAASDFTATGARRVAVVPSPSWPNKLLPQQDAPAVVCAQVAESPAATSLTPTSVTGVGVLRSAVVVSPSAPVLLSPQHRSWPIVSSAQLCAPPAAIRLGIHWPAPMPTPGIATGAPIA